MTKLQPITTEVIRLGKSNPQAGGWYNGVSIVKPSARQRLGYSQAAYDSSILETSNSHYSFYRTHRSLMPSQYWSLYKTSPDVRACIDSIVRRIATWDWAIRPTVDPHDKEEFARVDNLCKEMTAFMKVPSTDGVTWQETMTAMVTDLLVYDAGVLELVNDSKGDLAEITTWLGSECFPVVDKYGQLHHYDQESEDGETPTVELSRETICYFQLFKNNRSTLGLPIIESIINECVGAILADEHAMLALDADEIPPGLLVLGGVAGPAAERARADLQSMKGKDHKIRVITSPQPQGIEARWIELRHTPKDLELRQVVDQMRRIIWRVFGVTPVELGVTDGIPRAAAEVQMDVASSHLISPLLELIQARVNAQIMPRLIEDTSLVKFTFDRALPQSAGERLDTARRAEVLLRNGALTINEVRAEMGYLPVEGGDTPYMITSLGPMPLDKIAEGISQEVLGADKGYGAELAKDKVDIIRESDCCGSDHRSKDWRSLLKKRSRDEWLPSDWQPEAKFKGSRTLPLTKLAELVSEYTREATNLYVDAGDQVSAIVASAFGSSNSMSISDSLTAKRRVNRALDELLLRWRLRTEPYYFDATKMGFKAAEEAVGDLPMFDHKQAASDYLVEAMQWLEDSRGLVGTLRKNVIEMIDRAALAQVRSERIDSIDIGSSADHVIDSVDSEFAAQAHRVENWSGKLVALASSSMSQSVQSTVTTNLLPDPDTGEPSTTVWYYEWAAASGQNCATCSFEGGAGYREVSQATVLPGQGTICGARCRCVIVYWTKQEVDTGHAVSLTDLPSNPTGSVAPPLPSY
jgi:hypothetical protein